MLLLALAVAESVKVESFAIAASLILRLKQLSSPYMSGMRTPSYVMLFTETTTLQGLLPACQLGGPVA